MKTKIFTLAVFSFLFTVNAMAQDVTTVNAKSSDISDNLDLRAVASIFGESADLADFENRLNNPKYQISNLDLNNDGNVDYLRVIETVDNGTHLIVIQSVLEKDVFQDIATVEVEKGSNNEVQVQVVGNVYMYGPSYIYEPVYVSRPVIYNTFWAGYYRPYYSPWYWDYYPTYYHYWAPYPVFRYRRNVNVYINVHNHYNYVRTRRSERAVAMYSGVRANGYERQHPDRSFADRNHNVSNRHDLEVVRGKNSTALGGGRTKNGAATTRGSVRNNDGPIKTNPTRGTGVKTPKTQTGNTPVRANNTVRNNDRTLTPARSENNAPVKVRTESPAAPTRSQETSIRTETPRVERNNTPAIRTERTQTAPRVEQRNNVPARSPERQIAPQRQSSPAPQRDNTNERGNRRG